MASLAITVGALTASITATDLKAAEVLNRYADSIGATGTNQQRANAVITSLVQYMVKEGRRHLGAKTMDDAAIAIQAELEAMGWD